METLARFKDAAWLQESKKLSVNVVGLGGIGSHTAVLISKSIRPKMMILVDMDVVEYHNVGTQYYDTIDVGNYKASALANHIKTPCIPLFTRVEALEDSFYQYDVTISAVDSMKTRRAIFDKWLDGWNSNKVLIDGRLNATSYEVFFVRRNNSKEVEVYNKSLLSDDVIPDGSCTMRQTYHFGTMIGSRITNLLSNYLSNIVLGSEVYSVPFFVREMGDLVHIKTMNCDEYDGMISKFTNV